MLRWSLLPSAFAALAASAASSSLALPASFPSVVVVVALSPPSPPPPAFLGRSTLLPPLPWARSPRGAGPRRRVGVGGVGGVVGALSSSSSSYEPGGGDDARGYGSGGGGFGDVVGTSSTGGTENDFRTFLNQCSIQSFMFLLKSTRDPHTVRWLDNFTRPAVPTRDLWPSEEVVRVGHLSENIPPSASSSSDGDDGGGDGEIRRLDTVISSELLRYHGLGAINSTVFPTWDSYFRDLLDMNPATVVVETHDPRFPEFEIDIDPGGLCSRILSVREQIATEFASDLGAVASMGRDVRRAYWDEIRRSRESGDGFGREGEGGEGAGTTGLERPSLIFLEWDPNYDEDARPSPLRRGNFDLLCLLCTQEAVHRLLRDGVPGDGGGNTLFLRDFYSERLYSHFTGAQRYGRADDFLEELMLSPPRVVSGGGDGGDGGGDGDGDGDGGREAIIVDPLGVADALLDERERVAMEWREAAEGTAREHVEIQRMRLNKMMGL